MILSSDRNLSLNHTLRRYKAQVTESESDVPSSQLDSCPPGPGLTPIHYPVSLTVSYVRHVAINRSGEVPECLLQLIIHHSKGMVLWPQALPDRQTLNNNRGVTMLDIRNGAVKPYRGLFQSLLKPPILREALCLMCLGNLLAFAPKAFL